MDIRDKNDEQDALRHLESNYDGATSHNLQLLPTDYLNSRSSSAASDEQIKNKLRHGPIADSSALDSESQISNFVSKTSLVTDVSKILQRAKKRDVKTYEQSQRSLECESISINARN